MEDIGMSPDYGRPDAGPVCPKCGESLTADELGDWVFGEVLPFCYDCSNAGNCLCCGDWYTERDDADLCADCAALDEMCRPARDMDAYQAACLRTWNNGGTQLNQLCNAALGLGGECGELMDLLKKTLFHDHELDMDAVESEAGDVLYYLAVLLAKLGVSLSYTAEYNIAKLRERYPDGFDSERSRERNLPPQPAPERAKCPRCGRIGITRDNITALCGTCEIEWMLEGP